MPSILLNTPIGAMLLEHDGAAVTGLRFWREGAHPPAGTRDEPARDDAFGRRAVEQLRAYFSGEARSFDLPVHAEGTEFQRRIWDELTRIPYGQTVTYGELAARVGRPGAARAVGQANARNPVPVVVPCHRVLASGGGIGGYVGEWGEGESIARKRWLLGHESDRAVGG